MINKSRVSFIHDSFIRMFSLFENFYTFYKNSKSFDIDNNLRSLYDNTESYLYDNALILGNRIEKIHFHERFGWILNSGSNKSFLGKLIFSGKFRLDIGNYSYFSGAVTINGSDELKIGSFCSIANGTQFFLSNINHPTSFASTYNFQSNARIVINKESIDLNNFKDEIEKLSNKKNIIIGNDVWIGRDVMILNGVKIGDGCVIGARSTVFHDCEPYGVYVGTPAKLVKYRFDKNIINQLLEIEWWNWNIETIKRNNLFFNTNFKSYDKPLTTLFDATI